MTDEVRSVARALHWSLMHQVVAEYHDEGTFNDKVATDVLKSWTAFCRKRGEPVDLPPLFAELLAKALAGELEPRRGRRAKRWIYRRVAAQKFLQAQAQAREGNYDALLIEFSKNWGVSESTFKTWLSQEKARISDSE